MEVEICPAPSRPPVAAPVNISSPQTQATCRQATIIRRTAGDQHLVDKGVTLDKAGTCSSLNSTAVLPAMELLQPNTTPLLNTVMLNLMEDRNTETTAVFR